MVVKTSYNRRSFLKVSTATGGGLMLGFSWLASCTPTPEEVRQMPENWFDINGFLKIGDNGLVTIQSPNPEIGQNVKTAMPMIVAEELDVAWKDVIVEQAPLNTEIFTRQLAGGSQSIRQGWDGLRMAGASARRLLLEAAAQQWEVPVEELTTAEGVIHHEVSGQSIGYGAVASNAGSMELPEEIDLKEREEYKIIGKPTKNVDGPDIVTGKPLFGLDVMREGMKIAMIVHPPAFGLRVGSIINQAEVEAMPGVDQVFTIQTDREDLERQWSDTNAFTELVTVVGATTWQVMQAKKALQIEWQQDSPGENSAMHAEDFDRLLQLPAQETPRRDGNPEAAFAAAHQVIERTFTAPFLAHNTMEPMNFFANVTADKAELEGPIQTPEYLRPTVAALLDMEESQVSIMMTRMGGGFGRRLYGHFGVEAAVISKEAGAPIKLVYTREDDMTQGTYRPAYKVIYRAALDEAGNLTGFHIKGAGTYGSPVFANRFPAGAVDNYLVENYTQDSNISCGAWRAPRSNFIAGAEQSFLDEVAEAAGRDPIEFRLDLFRRAIDQPVGENNDYDAERYAGVLELVKEKANWGSERSGVHRGVAAYYCHNSYVAQVVDMVMDGDRPVIDKVWNAVDCGIVINPEGARNQIEGGVIDGIGHAMYSAITFEEGRPQQQNFDRYRLIRHEEAPRAIEVFFVDNGIAPTGLGEPGLPPAIGALANAMYQLSKERPSAQPFAQQAEEVLPG
ncbi:MAG: molybdopterin cofactor-binding domain-containing protein [Bacteroidota bacterium]